MIDVAIYKILELAGEASGCVRFSDLRSAVENPRTLSRKIKLLLEKGLLAREGRGYRITERGSRVLYHMREILELVGARGEPEISNIDRIPHRYYAPLVRRYCELLLERFGDRLLGVVLFGSVGRGDWTRDSDIDLLVVVDGWEGVPVWRRIRELYEVRERLRETREYRAALRAGFVPAIQHYPLGRREALEFHRAYLDIVLDGIVVYDREGFVRGVLESVRKRLAECGARRISRPDGKYYWVIKEVRAGEVYAL